MNKGNSQVHEVCYPGMDTITSESSYVGLIYQAIKDKQRLSFVYNEKERISEPQCCGKGNAGNDLVRMHMLRGGSRTEQLFEVAQIKSLKVLNEFFDKPGPNYNPEDSAIKIIYCKL